MVCLMARGNSALLPMPTLAAGESGAPSRSRIIPSMSIAAEGGAEGFGECAGDVLVPSVIEENNSGVKFCLLGASF